MTEIRLVNEAGYWQVGGSRICKWMHIIFPNLINTVVFVVSCHKSCRPTPDIGRWVDLEYYANECTSLYQILLTQLLLFRAIKFAGPPIPGIIVIARKCIHQEGHHWRINTECCNVGIHILHTPQIYLEEVGRCIFPRVLYHILLYLTWCVFLFVNDATHSHLWNFNVCLHLMFMHVHCNS